VGVFVCESPPLGFDEDLLKWWYFLDRNIHPQAILSQIYFENIFCLCAISSADGKTDIGVRVALGDSSA